MRQGKLVVVDGIDGCGKSTIIRFFKEELERQGARIFDLPAYSKANKRLPLFNELPEAGVIISAEPTYAWIGPAIREEILREEAEYGVLYAIDAFALDRAIQLKRVILPALEAGITVIQDRSFLSSLAYQSAQGGIQMKNILDAPGNALAAANPPDIFIFADCPVSAAVERLQSRAKKDASLFEKTKMLELIRAKFHAAEMVQYLREKKIERMIINTDKGIDEVRADVSRLTPYILARP